MCCDRYQMVCGDKLHEIVTAENLAINAQAVDLIQRLLRPDPSNRLTISEIKQHPWLQ